MAEIGRNSWIAGAVLSLAMLLAPYSSAQQCGLSVSVSGRSVTATVSGGNCGGSAVMMHRDDRTFVVNASCPEQTTCTATYELSACETPRTYELQVVGQCGQLVENPSGGTDCNAFSTESAASVTVDPVAPAVDLSYVPADNGQGRLLVSYSFPDEAPRGIHLYRDESTTSFASANDLVLVQREGVWEVPLDVSCWPSGTHRIRAEAAMCGNFGDERYTGEGGTSITIDNEPQVSLSAAEAVQGQVTFTSRYRFQNTSGGRLDLWVDGTLVDSEAGLSGSGEWVETVALGACWRNAKVVATGCGETAEDEIAPEQRQPRVDVVLRRDEATASGSRMIKGRIEYDMQVPGSEPWNVSARVSRYIDIAGVEHAGWDLTLVSAQTNVSGVKTFELEPPSGARQIWVIAKVTSCAGGATDDAMIECDVCTGASADPVFFADGNMLLSDTDPLPAIAGHVLARTYNSDEQATGLFGRGWTTMFDRRLTAHAEADGERIVLTTDNNEGVVFRRSASGAYVQTWPKGRSAVGTLRYDGTSAGYVYHAPGSSEVAVFRAGDGRLVALRLGTGQEARIEYDVDGRPVTLADSWTGVRWTLTTSGRRVTAITVPDRPELSWSYQYDGSGNLITVFAPGGATWRTYEYASNRLTASRDGAGNLIESHDYDANGYAINSTGPNDEIANIQYNLAGSTPDEVITRVTMKTTATTDYVLRPVGGAWRVVQVVGSGCVSCGGNSGNRTYVHDSRGRVVRQQGADGYVTASTYAGDHLVMEEQHLRGADCDPQTDAGRCRMTTDALAAAVLVPTAATIRTEYGYGDVNWPERPTTVSRPSITGSGRFRREDVSYHGTSGAVVARTVTGFADAEGARIQRGTITTLYEQRPGGEDGDEDGFAPAFDPGGVFEAGWLSLPQPALVTKSVDGPRGDVGDVTAFVYYPIHESVPPLLRGRLAAVRNAAGHITRYESYDVFGNAARVVDANGVATEMTYDLLGRPEASTMKGQPGCDASQDPVCSVDLTMTRTYSPPAGPLRSERRPGGGTTVYTYDERGRVRTISRGPSATELREQIETTHDPQTGRKSLERTLAYEGGTWVEKTRQSFGYNAFGELTTITHADSTSIEYTYDAAGRLASIRDENHAEANTTHSYDPAGRLETVRQKLAGAPGGWISTRYAYDVHGNLVAVTDPNGNVTSYTYDDFGQMIQQRSAVTAVTKYDYDEAGNLKHVVDANGITTTRSYDALGRVISAVSAVPGSGGGGEDDGRGGPSPPPTTSTRPEAVTWVYDDPAPDRFAIGRLSSMTDPAGTTLYAYERRGLLTEEQRSFNGCFVTRESGANCDEFFETRTFVTGYRYDRDGNRSSIHYPSNKVNVNYTFDFAGRPLSASGAVTSAEYLPFGPMRLLTFANGVTQTLSYDARYRVTENALSSATGTLARYVYGYDGAGNVTGIEDALDPAYNRAFGYDDLNRIVTANTGPALWRSGSYTWDAMGNPQTVTLGEVAPGGDDGLLRGGRPVRSDTQWLPGGRTQVFMYADTTPRINRVTTNASPSTGDGGDLLRIRPPVRSDDASAGVPVTYDAAGNETGYLVTRTYSPRNLLTEVVRRADEEGDPFEHKLLYSYDGRGIRVVRGEKPSDGISAVARRYSIYTPDLRLLSVTKDDAPNIWSAAAAEKDMKFEIIWFGDRPVAQVPLTGGRSYTFTDHLGTPILQTNDEGAVVWRAEYEPFGNLYAMRTDANGEDIGRRTDQPLRFPGQEVAMAWEGQEENYNIYRWYRSGWGRYTQADPMGWDSPWSRIDRRAFERDLFEGAAIGSTYAYALGAPTRMIDPTGESAVGAALPLAGGCTAIDGPLPIGDAVALVILVGAAIYDLSKAKEVSCSSCEPKKKQRWMCNAQCNTQVFDPRPGVVYPPRLTGIGFGSSEAEACTAAKASATGSAPPGSYGRHCRCTSCWKN